MNDVRKWFKNYYRIEVMSVPKMKHLIYSYKGYDFDDAVEQIDRSYIEKGLLEDLVISISENCSIIDNQDLYLTFNKDVIDELTIQKADKDVIEYFKNMSLFDYMKAIYDRKYGKYSDASDVMFNKMKFNVPNFTYTIDMYDVLAYIGSSYMRNVPYYNKDNAEKVLTVEDFIDDCG